jgi:hypothetical protein
MARLPRTIAMRITVVALVISGCALSPALTGPPLVVETTDGREVIVECRTDVGLSHGDCGGWAVGVLRGDPDNVLDVSDTARVVLSGVIAPGPDQDRCQADMFDAIGRLLRSARVRCYVPSGG